MQIQLMHLSMSNANILFANEKLEIRNMEFEIVNCKVG